ncbi:hypothetical protein JAO10_21215 [Burkholderia contaminans]|uniref:hypothetical protein n=1 Tax=Burkholderia contaminans TaxID=488447 RepID=UPI0018DCC5DE|nr:hypothetical protein [Burkholderia contaminans]MBH9722850.1 hypothetical protein [Burkholderia contaminans]
MSTGSNLQKPPRRPPLPGYFEAYGGFKTLFTSRFFWAAIIITGLSYPFWSIKDWWNVVTTVLPTILGFTIAAFALVIGLGAGVFKRQLHRARKSGKPPMYLQVSGIFVHQIVVQASAILFAVTLAAIWLWPAPTEEPWVMVNEWARRISWGIGFFLFVYSILLVIAGALNLYTLAKLIQRGTEIDAEREARERAEAARAKQTASPVQIDPPGQSSDPQQSSK